MASKDKWQLWCSFLSGWAKFCFLTGEATSSLKCAIAHAALKLWELMHTSWCHLVSESWSSSRSSSRPGDGAAWAHRCLRRTTLPRYSRTSLFASVAPFKEHMCQLRADRAKVSADLIHGDHYGEIIQAKKAKNCNHYFSTNLPCSRQ